MSETVDPADAASLSFVDVIANGMGSMLVLFILMTLIRASVDFGAVEQTGASTGTGDGEQAAGKEPFVILVTTPAKVQLFAPLGGQLQLDPQVAWVLLDPIYKKTVRLNVGANYAAFYAPAPPPPGEAIALAGLNPNAVILVQVYRGSGPPLTAVPVKVDGAQHAIWPVPEAKGGDR